MLALLHNTPLGTIKHPSKTNSNPNFQVRLLSHTSRQRILTLQRHQTPQISPRRHKPVLTTGRQSPGHSPQHPGLQYSSPESHTLQKPQRILAALTYISLLKTVNYFVDISPKFVVLTVGLEGRERDRDRICIRNKRERG